MKDKLNRITRKKLELDSLKPLPEIVSRQMDDWLRVELTYASNAIEGNTLTRLETAEILEKGVSATVGRKPLKDQLEALNHAKAYDFIRDLAVQKDNHRQITEDDILAIHRLVLDGIDDEWAGRYRESQVFVKGTDVTFPAASQVPYHMAEFVDWLTAEKHIHPVELAAAAHFRLVSIHPFVDGNGRTARLLMNLILLVNDYPVAVIRNEERTDYLHAINQGQTQKQMSAFYQLVVGAVERSLDAYLAAARGKPALKPFGIKPLPRAGALLQIGELAQKTGESIHTLRFWTKLGLLSVKAHTKGGYQLFDPSMVERARRIRELQRDKRLTLSEIGRELQAA